MAQPQSGRQFVDLLRQSQLLDAELLQQLEPQLGQLLDGDPSRLAKAIIKANLATEYQVRQLLAGRYKGFYIGKYKLLDVLGAGGMGKVFLAEQITMERLVALKVLGKIRRPERQKEILARFKREAKAVAALNHPNIVHAYDFDEEYGLPYIVMEFVEGIDTARLVSQFGPLAPAQAAEFTRQAAAGLQHAHQAGLVHRDVKPGNLLVDRDGTVKLLDLGLVSALDDKRDDSITVDQDQLGTVDYIAPEQAQDSRSVDARADVYSLGATLYALLAGTTLYPGKSTAQKLVLHQTEMPRPIREINPEIPVPLAQFITRMLAKQREERPQTMLEVQQGLQAWAQPHTPAYDASAIKLRHDVFDPFLAKSPDLAQISAESLTQPESGIRRNSGANATKPASQPSMIGLDAGCSNEFDAFSMSGDFSELPLTLPKRVVKPRKSTAKSKAGPADLNRWLALGGIAGGVAVMLLLSLVFFSGEAESTVVATPKPAASAASTRKPKPAETPRSTYNDWLKSTEALAADPKLVAHYRLLDPWGEDLTVRSDAGSGGEMPLTVVKGRWADGRWPRKGAVSFGGPASGQYAAFSTQDSKKLDLQKATTIAVWFKVDRFSEPWQVLIGKGDRSWTLRRTEERDTLSFIIHKVTQPAGKGHPEPVLSEVRLDGRQKVNDGYWHLAIMVLSPVGRDRIPTLRLFIDGRLDGRSEAGKPYVSKDPIWIAADSSPAARKSGATRNFDGLIDEVIVWHKPLDDAGVQALYRVGHP
ncbi:MAG: protein kinase domain-containing protein [Planctomycetaceae bacterium]